MISKKPLLSVICSKYSFASIGTISLITPGIEGIILKLSLGNKNPKPVDWISSPKMILFTIIWSGKSMDSNFTFLVVLIASNWKFESKVTSNSSVWYTKTRLLSDKVSNVKRLSLEILFKFRVVKAIGLAKSTSQYGFSNSCLHEKSDKLISKKNKRFFIVLINLS